MEIVRNEHGIPFIRAASESDLSFAQGFVHAQDRFWQMAPIRQSMKGRLAEWMGPAGVRQDRVARTYRWSQLAERSLEAVPDRERRLLDAYTAGATRSDQGHSMAPGADS